MGESTAGFGLLSLHSGCFWGLSNTFRALFFKAWQLKVSAQLADRTGFRGAQFLDVKGALQLLISSHLLLRSILSRGLLNGLLLGKARNQDVRCGDGHLFWDCTSLPPPPSPPPPPLPSTPVHMIGNFLNSCRHGPAACFGAAGCLVLVLLESETCGRLIWVSWLTGHWNRFWEHTLLTLQASGPHLMFGMLMILNLVCRVVPPFGLMAVGKIEVAGAGVFLPAPEEAFRGSRRSMVMLDWSAAASSCLSRTLSKRFSALSFGVRVWRCRPSGLVILALII